MLKTHRSEPVGGSRPGRDFISDRLATASREHNALCGGMPVRPSFGARGSAGRRAGAAPVACARLPARPQKGEPPLRHPGRREAFCLGKAAPGRRCLPQALLGLHGLHLHNALPPMPSRSVPSSTIATAKHTAPENWKCSQRGAVSIESMSHL